MTGLHRCAPIPATAPNADRPFTCLHRVMLSNVTLSDAEQGDDPLSAPENVIWIGVNGCHHLGG